MHQPEMSELSWQLEVWPRQGVWNTVTAPLRISVDSLKLETLSGLYCPWGRDTWMTFQSPLTPPHIHLEMARKEAGRTAFLPGENHLYLSSRASSPPGSTTMTW